MRVAVYRLESDKYKEIEKIQEEKEEAMVHSKVMQEIIPLVPLFRLSASRTTEKTETDTYFISEKEKQQVAEAVRYAQLFTLRTGSDTEYHEELINSTMRFLISM